MKNYLIVLLLYLGISHVCLAQQADNIRVIADGRLPLVATEQTAWLTHPIILHAAEQGKQYWQKHNSVYEDNFRIMDSSEGGFTRAESKQTAVLYLLSLWPRCCSNMGLAIIENDQLVRNIVFAGGTQRLFSVADVNDDGLNELALIGSFGMGGSNETSLSLISFSTDSTTLLGRFPLVQENCATFSENSEHNSFRISFDENAPNEFKLEQYHRECEHSENVVATSVTSVPIKAIKLSDDYIDLPIN